MCSNVSFSYQQTHNTAPLASLEKGRTSYDARSLTPTVLFFSPRSFWLVPFAFDEDIVEYLGETWGGMYCAKAKRCYLFTVFLQKIH